MVAESLEVCGFVIRSQIIWAKSRFVLGRGNTVHADRAGFVRVGRAVVDADAGHRAGAFGKDSGSRCHRTASQGRDWLRRHGRLHQRRLSSLVG
ncbi:hypothetical protein WCLP8_2940003 [uncultured Gammaproteobacteria bacterium]